MVRDRRVPLQHRTVRYGRSFLEGELDPGEQAQIFPAADVGIGLRVPELVARLLRDLQVHAVKSDESFVTALEARAQSRVIAESTVHRVAG